MPLPMMLLLVRSPESEDLHEVTGNDSDPCMPFVSLPIAQWLIGTTMAICIEVAKSRKAAPLGGSCPAKLDAVATGLSA